MSLQLMFSCNFNFFFPLQSSEASLFQLSNKQMFFFSIANKKKIEGRGSFPDSACFVRQFREIYISNKRDHGLYLTCDLHLQTTENHCWKEL